MRRPWRWIAAAGIAVAAAAGAAVWHAAFRAPAVERLALPPALIDADSAAGRELLGDRDFVADHAPLAGNFESQARAAWCGVASSVMVLNALGGNATRLTQPTFFTERAGQVRSALQVTFGGMTLEQLAALLRAHGAAVDLHHASTTNVDAFRALARDNLASAGDFIVVNYQRAELGQPRIGHISPLAAYNAAADRLLVLDVATYRYPPTWVSTDALWKAMNTIDPDSGKTRGFLVVRRGR